MQNARGRGNESSKKNPSPRTTRGGRGNETIKRNKKTTPTQNAREWGYETIKRNKRNKKNPPHTKCKGGRATR